jgi:DNA-binding MarR family transcriptional regulator
MSQDALHQDTETDAVDAIVAQWRTERPDLDPAAKHITGRIVRLAWLFQSEFERTKGAGFGKHGLKETDFGVLSALRRSGEPYELTPTELARHRMITSGGMTAALDRLEAKGMIVRHPNPNDRRGSLVRLTEPGRELIDGSMVLHAQVEHTLVASLGEKDAKDLERLLRKLLIATEARMGVGQRSVANA